MGKTASCWISTREIEELEALYKEYGINTYQALKTGLAYVLKEKPFKKLSKTNAT